MRFFNRANTAMCVLILSLSVSGCTNFHTTPMATLTPIIQPDCSHSSVLLTNLTVPDNNRNYLLPSGQSCNFRLPDSKDISL